MTSEALKELIRSTGYTTPSQLTVDNAGRNYICKFVADDEPYIIKIYSGETKQQIKKVYEKLSELKNTRKSCKFPNVIKSGIYHEDFYVIEEYIEGISLADYLNQENSISISEIISVIKKICDAVKPLHELNPAIVHCDVTPKNIILEKNKKNQIEDVYIIDFDIAHVIGEQRDMVYGTKGYLAQEVANEEPCIQSDVYSIGVILERMVTKWCSDGAIDSICKKELETIIETSKKEKSYRYSNTDALKQALVCVETLYILNQYIDKFKDEKRNILVYKYNIDGTDTLYKLSKKLKKQFDEHLEVLYAICDQKKRIVAFTKEAMYSIIPQQGVLALTDKHEDKIIKVDYKSILAIRENTKVKANRHNWISLVSQTNDTWEYMELDLSHFKTNELCTLISEIVEHREHCYNKHNCQTYYYSQCEFALKKLQECNNAKNSWRNIIITLGEAEKERAGEELKHRSRKILESAYAAKIENLKNEISAPGLKNKAREKKEREKSVLEEKLCKLRAE